MGLLKRLKQSTSVAPPVASSSQSTTPDPAPSPSSTTPTRPKFGTASSRRSALNTLARPELSPSAASSHSIASRLSKARWKDRRRSRTKDELVGGPAYDGSPDGQGVQPVPEGESMVISDDLNHTTSRVYSETASLPPSPIKAKARPASEEYKQEGGILGRLNFESGFVEQSTKDENQLHSWLGGAGQDQQAAGSHSPVLDQAEADAPRASEEIEVLESAEKKNKFWKGKGRIRRLSKARSEIEDDLTADASPTPRKVSLPPVETPVDPKPATLAELHHPRPQTLRRPSSSFFQNTFIRSASRTSMKDIEVPISTEDDGSFQLKGFRHVSGTADVDMYNQYSAQQALSKDQSPPISPTKAGLAQSIEKTTTPNNPPPSAYYNSLPRPKIPSSRPASAAGSVTSLDELMIASPKISAGAFRRGARRQSENVLVPMDPNAKAVEEEEDDDDMPLAMTRGRRRMSLVSMPAATLETSSPAVVPLKVQEPVPIQPEVKVVRSKTDEGSEAPMQEAIPLANRSHTSSISPSPSFTLLKRADRPSSAKGFVVKSATSTRQERQSTLSRAQSVSRPPAFESPVSTKPSTPAPPDEPEILLSPMDIQEIEKTLAPPLIAPNDKRAQPQAVVSQPIAQTPSLVKEMEATSALQTIRSPPPPVAPLVLPEPGDTTPSSTDLPLPPDEMPATPPPISGLPSRPPSSQSPERKKTSLGILEEPLRVISAFWAASPPDPLSPDKTPRRVSQPVETPLAGPSSTPRGKQDIIARPKSVPLKSASSTGIAGKEADDELELWAVSSQHLLSDGSGDERAPSRMTLFDASAASSPSLQNRKSTSSMNAFGNAPGRAIRTSLSSLNTNIERAQASHAQSSEDGPLSGPASGATPLATSFRGRPQTFSQGGKPPARGKAAWSSSESDSGAETESPSPRPPARAKGSVRRVPQGPRKISGSAPSSPEKARKASRRVSGPRAPRRPSVQRRKVPSDSSSGDEKLSTLRERVSSSRLSQYKVSPARSTATLPTSPRRHQPGPSTSTGYAGSHPSSSHAADDRASQGYPTVNTFHGASQSGQSPSHAHIPGRPAFHRTATSPGSSRSGRTSESFGQHVVTPRSGDYPPSLDAQGGYTDTEPRQRRMSTASSHWSGMTAPVPMHPGVDPNLMRTAMKQAWQAQFMAAAYRASEEEWERASSVGGEHTAPSPVPPGFPPYGIPPFPYGYPMPYPPPPSTPFQYPYAPPPGVIPPYIPQPVDMGGCQFAPASQSVFGGDFGPPTQMRQGPVSPSGPVGPAQYYTLPTNPGPDVQSAAGTRGQFDDPETPRRTRRSSMLHYAN